MGWLPLRQSVSSGRVEAPFFRANVALKSHRGEKGTLTVESVGP